MPQAGTVTAERTPAPSKLDPPGNRGHCGPEWNRPAMRLLVGLLVWLLRASLVSRGALALENLALRQQLTTYARTQKRPRLKPEERAFWVALSRVWRDWRSPLAFVKPATVIDWHRRGFRRYWRWRSCKPGRPRIPAEHIAFIRRISTEQPGWGEDRITLRAPPKPRWANLVLPVFRDMHPPYRRRPVVVARLCPI